MLTLYTSLRLLSALFFIIVFSVSSQAQSASPNDREIPIVYQSPASGDMYVPTRTTLIIKPDASQGKALSPLDYIFDVRGESSGKHPGLVVIGDDDETIIFKPDNPFTLDERVRVGFSIKGQSISTPYCYDFQITQMTDSQQVSILNTLKKNEQIENQTNIPQNAEHRTWHMYQLNAKDSLSVSIDTLIPEKVAPGNIFAAQTGGEVNSFVTIIDNAGTPNFLYNMPSAGYSNFRAYMNNALSYFSLGVDSVGESPKGFELDTNLVPIDSFACGNGYLANEHEFQLLRKGHALMIAYDPVDMDMRKVTGDTNAAKRASVIGGIIQELDSKKNVIFQWRTWDHFQISDAVHFNISDPNNGFIDYAHLNSARLDSDGNILASFRAMDEVTKINRSNGKIIWRWGGKNNYFTFAGDTLQFSSQHDVQRLATGTIVMFDNGNYRKTLWGDGSYHDTSYSRAIEYNLDESSLTATPVWQYRDIPYSSAGGNFQRLKNGNTFIGLGIVNIPNAVEITPEGEKVFQMSFLLGGFNYRTFRYDYPPLSAFSSSVHLAEKGISIAINSIFPNPAETKATISFSAPEEGSIQIDLINVLGEVIHSVVERVSGAGTYSTELDLHDLTTGAYYCKLSQANTTLMKMIVVRK